MPSDQHERGVRLAPILVVLAAGVGVACGGPFPQSSLAPASDFARMIDDLFRSIFWWAMLVFVVVEGVLIYTLVRFRDRGGDETPEPVHGNTLLEIGWTLAPAVILVLIAVPTIRTIWLVDNPPRKADVLQVEVVGHQWWWEFSYPDLEVTTANELHVPVGRTVQLTMRSADVIHSFWVPRLGGKRDVNPGEPTSLWFTADSAGRYDGQCAEFCGTAHSLMRLDVVAQPEEEFDRWVERQGRPAAEPETELARRGQEAFVSNACISCHTIEGTVAQGRIGPELTHFASREELAAGVLPNDSAGLARWLENPQEVKPGNFMKINDLDDETIAELVAYLQSLR